MQTFKFNNRERLRMGRDIEANLRRLVGISSGYVIRSATISSHGQVITISHVGSNNCKQIGVTFNDINKIMICKDDPCNSFVARSDKTETCEDGLVLSDLVNTARLINQRYRLAKKIHDLIVVSEIVGEELSAAQNKALQELQNIFNQKNLFKIEGEREIIFRIVIDLGSNLKSIKDVQNHKAIGAVMQLLHCNGDGNREFNICTILQNIFDL